MIGLAEVIMSNSVGKSSARDITIEAGKRNLNTTRRNNII